MLTKEEFEAKKHTDVEWIDELNNFVADLKRKYTNRSTILRKVGEIYVIDDEDTFTRIYGIN